MLIKDPAEMDEMLFCLAEKIAEKYERFDKLSDFYCKEAMAEIAATFIGDTDFWAADRFIAAIKPILSSVRRHLKRRNLLDWEQDYRIKAILAFLRQ